MKKRVLLVQPNYRFKKDASLWGMSPPMGLCYLAAVLQELGIEVEILDANVLNLTPQAVVQHAVNTKVDIVGVSVLTPVYNFSIQVAKLLPEDIVSVAGGPYPSAVPEDFLDQGFDIVVHGEGEYSLAEIASGRPFVDIRGISWQDNGGKVQNPSGEYLNPNELPLPARHLLINNGCDKPYYSTGTRYFPWARIHSSRGCPFDCNYCNKSIFGYNFRPRSPENVLGEIEFLVKNYKIREIDFSDDIFNLDINRAKAILDGIIKSKFKLCLRFSNGVRIDRIDTELLAKMKQAGTEYIAYGIESGDQDVLNSIPKHLTLDIVRDVVKMTKKAKIEVTGYFILGLLGDTPASMERTIEFAKSLDLDLAFFHMACPYPGTKMYEEIKKKGKLLVEEWLEYYHTAAKAAYRIDGMATPEEVEMMYRKAIREFYLRPSYILKKLLQALIKGRLSSLLLGAKGVIHSQK